MIDVYTDELRDLIEKVKEAHNCKNVMLLMSQEPSEELRNFAVKNGYKLQIVDSELGVACDMIYVVPEVGGFEYESC